MQLPNPSFASESEVVGQTPASVFDMALAGYALLLSLPSPPAKQIRSGPA